MAIPRSMTFDHSAQAGRAAAMSLAPKPEPVHDPLMSLCCCASSENPTARLIDAPRMPSREFDEQQLPLMSNQSSELRQFEQPVLPYFEESRQPSVCCLWSNPCTRYDWPSTFFVTIGGMPGLSLGVTLDTFNPARCIVRDIKPNGIIAHWNQACQPQEVVKQGDLVLEVNGHTGRADEIWSKLQTEIQQQPRIDIKIKRGKTLHVYLRRAAGDRVGLGLDRHEEGLLGVQVMEVRPNSLIGEYNRSNTDRVKVNDRILSVNGYRDHPSICRELRQPQASSLNLEVLTWHDDTTPSKNRWF